MHIKVRYLLKMSCFITHCLVSQDMASLELTVSNKRVDQFGICLLAPFLGTGVTRVLTHLWALYTPTGDPNLGPNACEESILSIDPSAIPLTHFINVVLANKNLCLYSLTYQKKYFVRLQGEILSLFLSK